MFDKFPREGKYVPVEIQVEHAIGIQIEETNQRLNGANFRLGTLLGDGILAESVQRRDDF